MSGTIFPEHKEVYCSVCKKARSLVRIQDNDFIASGPVYNKVSICKPCVIKAYSVLKEEETSNVTK